MLTRRGFVLAAGAFAAGAAFPASPKKPVRFGIVSDTHVRSAGDKDALAAAMRYFKSREIATLLHCGDVTDLGYIEALQAFADAKREHLGASVPVIVAAGNRDFSDTSSMTEERLAADRGKLILSDVQGSFESILGAKVTPSVGAVLDRDVWIVYAPWKQEGALEEYFLANPEIVASGKPVVVLQHPHPPGTVFADETWGGGDAKSTCWLKMFPDAVSFSGHSHLGFDRADSAWNAGFNALAAGCHNLGNGVRAGARDVSILEISGRGATLTRTDLVTGSETVRRLGGAFVRPAAPQLRQRTRESVRLMQWNVGHFAMGKRDTTTVRAEDGAAAARRFVDEIGRASPDVIGFCEFADDFDLGGRKTAEILREAGYDVVRGPWNGFHYNALAFKGIRHGAAQTADYAQREQKAYWLCVDAVVGGKVVTFVQTHLDVGSASCRTAQAKELVGRFGQLERVVISGDFNVADAQEYAPFFAAGFAAANCAEGRLLPTHRRREAAYTPAIDNVFVRGFRFAAAAIGDYGLRISDHRPLSCLIQPEDEAERGRFRPVRIG